MPRGRESREYAQKLLSQRTSMKGQRTKTHVFLSILFKNTVFCDKIIRRPDKENPGPAPLNEHPGAIWEPFWHQSPKQLKMSIQRPSESNSGTRAQNSSKWASRGHLRVILALEPRIAQNEPPEAIWEQFWQRSPEQLKMSLQGPSERGYSHVNIRKSCPSWGEPT